jgi:hypothetical protein
MANGIEEVDGEISVVERSNIKLEGEIILPKVPQTFKMSTGQRLPVTALSDETLEQIGADYTAQLLAAKHK